jgi:chitin synthase
VKTLEGKPLLCSNPVLDAFALNVVDTLHLKNLLHLGASNQSRYHTSLSDAGEDRYLTTLLLKHFPSYKTTFVPDASALTAAPESWKVLLSQRRRWINSTVHNLFELVLVDALCGMCCFSMRFVGEPAFIGAPASLTPRKSLLI